MTLKELKKELKKIGKMEMAYEAHIQADEALLKFINNDEVGELFKCIKKWYA